MGDNKVNIEFIGDAQNFKAAAADTERAAVESAKRVTQSTADTASGMAVTWRQFTSERMTEYRDLEGSHAAAMKRMSAEWAAYKASGSQAASATQGAVDGLSSSLVSSAVAAGTAANGLGSIKDGLASISEASTVMSGAVSAALGVLATLGIGFSLAGVVHEITDSIEVIDKFNLSVIQMSAILTSLQIANGTGSGNIAETYRETRDYAIQTNEALLKIEPSTSMSIQGLQRINLELAKAGVAIDTNNSAQVEGFKNLANAAAVFSQGGQNEVMLQSEIMLLMQGQASAHSRLGSAISAMVGGDLKTWVEQHKQAGDFLEQMNKVLAGFGPASKDIAGTWSAVKTSFETTVTIIQRGAMQEAFSDVVELTKEINEYLKSHADIIKNDVQIAWQGVRLAVQGMGAALNVLGTVVQSSILPLFDDLLTLVRGTGETLAYIVGVVAQSPGVFTALAVAVASFAVPAIAALSVAFEGLTTAIAASMATNPVGWAVLVGSSTYLAGKAAVTALDEIIHKYADLNLTGEAAYKDELKRAADANKAYDDVKQKALFAYREGGRMPGPTMQKELGIVNVPDTKQKTEEEPDDGKFAKQVKASHDAYAGYVKAFYEEQAALVKAANAQQEELNKESYDKGLTDLQTYLAAKHKLNEEALQAEIDAKLKELSTAGGLYENALAAYKKDPSADGVSANVWKAGGGVLEAIKAVTEAQSKLDLAKKTGAAETNTQTVDQLRGYQEIQAQYLEMQGQFSAAALIRKDLDESSVRRQALITEAMRGTAGAEAAYWAQEALDQQKSDAALYNQVRGYKELQAQMLDMQGDYAAAALIRKTLDENSLAYQQLIANAMAGNSDAEAAYWAQDTLNQQKSNDAVKKTAAERASIAIAEINNQLTLIDTAEKFYQITTSAAVQQRIVLLQQELLAQKAIYDSIQGNEPAAVMARVQVQAAIDRINEKLLVQQKILSDRTAIGGAISALKDYANMANNLGAQVNGAVTDMFKGMEGALTDFVTKGKLDFKSFANSIISDLARIAIQRSVTGPIATGVGGFLKEMFTPTAPGAGAGAGAGATGAGDIMAGITFTAATGFDVPRGVNPLTQLHEEEMVLPAQYADVIRKMAVGGGASANSSPNVQVNVINPPGYQVEVQSQQSRVDVDQMIIDVVLRKLKADPGTRAAFASGGNF